MSITTHKTWDFDGSTLFLATGDITGFTGDAVVNAANLALAGGGGVDGAIHRAAGPQLPGACREIIDRIGRLPAGQAVITPGFNMPAKYIIHTVGPVWHGGNQSEPEKLTSAYRESLLRAQENAVQSVAFPAVSCGVYGYPLDQAARIALTELKKGLQAGMVKQAGMVIFSPSSLNVWLDAAEQVL
ncbi:macro domain-containing protein [Desulfovibrio inopinatus]|uniref:macro domain-containing protein n=1 Tax=Desulfovibrio inopinatus TaxID=102109 RepID=UPI000428D2C5|nr:macro domain-containing protein [Desulfovibrio inopinatus]